LRQHEFATTDVGKFPFPVEYDAMRPRVDVEPACVRKQTEVGSWGGTMFVEDEGYERFLELKNRILDEDPNRFTSYPHMVPAQWDAMVFVMKQLSAEFPEWFRLQVDGDAMTWTNRKLGVERAFVFGDQESLPRLPLEYIGRQVQEDLLLLDVRDSQLYLDSALVTFSMGWSPTFTTGMTFHEAHGTLPRIMEDGTVRRAEKFLISMPPGEIYRRNPWSFQIGGRLDISMDSLPAWSQEQNEILADADGETLAKEVRMRSELSHFVRLPLTGSVLYTIRAMSITLEQLGSVPAWAQRTINVIEEHPKDLANHRGFGLYGPIVLPYLKERVAA
jgi:hypothetical protein